eukprot:199168-Pelagomonas_calceolata.AAC.1
MSMRQLGRQTRTSVEAMGGRMENRAGTPRKRASGSQRTGVPSVAACHKSRLITREQAAATGVWFFQRTGVPSVAACRKSRLDKREQAAATGMCVCECVCVAGGVLVLGRGWLGAGV